MRSIFMGTPDYALPVLDVLLSIDPCVVAVYTQPDKPRGRGLVPEPSPVKRFALEKGLAVYQPVSLRRIQPQQELAALHPDVIIVAAYGKILPPEVLNTPPSGCVNVHPSLLPRHRGPSPVATAILEGEAVTGTTLILLDEGMDSGPIFASREASMSPRTEMTPDLTRALFQLGGELLGEVLPRWMKGEVSPETQDPNNATFTSKLERGDGEARWELSAQELDRRLRAFTPWPGLFTHWKGRMLKILSGTPLLDTAGASLSRHGLEAYPTSGEKSPGSEEEPGLVVPLREPGIAVGIVAGEGILGIDNLQLEGRRTATGDEFIRGHRDFLGSQLPS